MRVFLFVNQIILVILKVFNLDFSEVNDSAMSLVPLNRNFNNNNDGYVLSGVLSCLKCFKVNFYIIIYLLILN